MHPTVSVGWATARYAAGADPSAFAQRLADAQPEEAEAIVDALVTRAVRCWQLDEATFWQRVRYQSRLVRATRRSGPG